MTRAKELTITPSKGTWIQNPTDEFGEKLHGVYYVFRTTTAPKLTHLNMWLPVPCRLQPALPYRLIKAPEHFDPTPRMWEAVKALLEQYTVAGAVCAVLRRALKETRGNVSEAALLVGVGKATFYRHIDRYNLESFVSRTREQWTGGPNG